MGSGGAAARTDDRRVRPRELPRPPPRQADPVRRRRPAGDHPRVGRENAPHAARHRRTRACPAAAARRRRRR
eukprot:5006167-Prymnesium_polylepis.1